jgi:hypothetical protein
MPALSTGELLAAGAAAGLLPFVVAHDVTRGLGLLSPYSIAAAATLAAAEASASAAALRKAGRVPASDSGGQRNQLPPSGPPGNAGAGAGAVAPGGLSSGVWCVILLCCVLHLTQDLRRHRIRLSPPAPAGVVFLLQRPG